MKTNEALWWFIVEFRVWVFRCDAKVGSIYCYICGLTDGIAKIPLSCWLPRELFNDTIESFVMHKNTSLLSVHISRYFDAGIYIFP